MFLDAFLWAALPVQLLLSAPTTLDFCESRTLFEFYASDARFVEGAYFVPTDGLYAIEGYIEFELPSVGLFARHSQITVSVNGVELKPHAEFIPNTNLTVIDKLVRAKEGDNITFGFYNPYPFKIASKEYCEAKIKDATILIEQKIK